MQRRSRRLVVWGPRILGILVCLFLSLFALDALGNGKTLRDSIPDAALHLAPALLLVALLVASWRWAWVGGFGFIAAAGGYAYVARTTFRGSFVFQSRCSSWAHSSSGAGSINENQQGGCGVWEDESRSLRRARPYRAGR